MTCPTCDGSASVRVPVPGCPLDGATYDDCPSCSASAMRAQRDEARAALALVRCARCHRRHHVPGRDTAAAAHGSECDCLEVLERDLARVTAQRDSARTALAALLDALTVRCETTGCKAPAMYGYAAWAKPSRCADHRRHDDAYWERVAHDAIEAAERELGRRGT